MIQGAGDRLSALSQMSLNPKNCPCIGRMTGIVAFWFQILFWATWRWGVEGAMPLLLQPWLCICHVWDSCSSPSVLQQLWSPRQGWGNRKRGGAEMEMEKREKKVSRSLRIWEEMLKEFQNKAKSSWSYAPLASLLLSLPYFRMRNPRLWARRMFLATTVKDQEKVKR